MESINRDHELWSQPYEPDKYEAPPLISWAAGSPPTLWGKPVVHFRDISQDLCTLKIERIDDKDIRGGIIVRNYEDMLVDYVEKTCKKDRPSFFKDGLGCKRIADKADREYIVTKMGEIESKIDEDGDYRIGLIKTTVKNFPHKTFREVKKLLDEHCPSPVKRIKMNPLASEFIPVQRKKRPKSSVTSESRLCWAMKGDTDKMIENLEARLAILEMLNVVPVVEAVQI